MEPLIVADLQERTVSIRIALEDVVVTESRYVAGEHGPDLHVHRLHADCFYVLAGSFTLSLDDGDRVLGAGTFVLVPPNVVHAFRNEGPDELRFLNLHAPGMRFDRYVQEIYGTGEEFRTALAARYDQFPPPEEGGLDPSSVIIRTAGSDAVQGAGIHIGFLANAHEALDAMGLVEYTAPPSFAGLPRHVHDRTWDAYYVLQGRLAVSVGEEQRELGPGDVIVVPPGTVHGFSNPSNSPTRFLDIHAPGGFERYFREVVEATGDGPLDPVEAARIASHYDVRRV